MNRNFLTGLSVAVIAIAMATAAFADDGNTVIQNERSFHPGEITIARGTTLNVENKDEFIHQIYVDSPNFNYDSEEQSPGQTLHIAFPQAGTFPVRCHIHPKMLLTVHVK